MGQMVGADIGDLERAGGELASLGKQITEMQRPLRAQLYATPWRGRTADRFRSDWDRIHGPALNAAGEFLRSAGADLSSQARQQSDASLGAGAGGGRGAIGSGNSPSLWDRFERGVGQISGAVTLLAWGTWVVSPAATIGRYTNVWRQVIKGVGTVFGPGAAKLMHFKRSPILQMIGKRFGISPAAAKHAGKVLGGAGRILSGFEIASSGARSLNALRQGDALGAWRSAVDTGDSVLKVSKVGMLGTFAVRIWKRNIETAREIDWSPEGLRMIPPNIGPGLKDGLPRALRGLGQDAWNTAF